MKPKFPPMCQVRITDPDLGAPAEGFVIESRFKDNRWIYKLSLRDPDDKNEVYENWIPEEKLENR